MLETKFNRSNELYNAEDIRWQYMNIPKFKNIVNSSSGAKDSVISDPFAIEQDIEQTNLRLGFYGNEEMKRRYDQQNYQLLRTVLLQFLNDSFNQHQSLIEAADEDTDVIHQNAVAVTEGSACLIS